MKIRVFEALESKEGFYKKGQLLYQDLFEKSDSYIYLMPSDSYTKYKALQSYPIELSLQLKKEFKELDSINANELPNFKEINSRRLLTIGELEDRIAENKRVIVACISEINKLKELF